MKPRVSIILLNMNQPAFTVDCIKSLQKCTYPSMEIIVVDQASNDNSLEVLSQFPDIKLIASKKNLGFTGGNNLAMMKATGEYFFLLNNDTEVTPKFLEPLIDALESDEKAGAASPLIRYYLNMMKIQYAGGPKRIDLILGRNSWRGWMSNYPSVYKKVESTSAAHSAAFIIKRKVAEQIGLLDDNFFTYYEELDWSLRIRKAKQKILFVPQSEIFHKDSMTPKKEHPFGVKMMMRNRILLSRKHLNKLFFFLTLGYVMLVSFPMNWLSYFVRRKRELLQAYTDGFWQGITNKKIETL